MATNQKFEQNRVNTLPTTGLVAGNTYALNVGGGKYKNFIVSDTLNLVSEAGAEFIEKDTMAQFRAITSREIWAIQNGYYKGVKLNGYYAKGDTPYPLNYFLSATVSADDGGSIIEAGGVKFEITESSVDLKHFGAKSDGNETSFSGTDNKPFLDNAINYISRIKGDLYINGKYFFKPLTITQSNVNIIISKDSFLITDLVGSQDKSIKITGGADKVTITGYGAILISRRYEIPLEEYRHNVALLYCSNVNIYGLKCIGGGGDGWYIGNDQPDQLPQNIYLKNISADNSYRNGISMVNGINVVIENPISENIVGTHPQAGIDIEPNSYAFERLEGIRIINPITRNCAQTGISFIMESYIRNAPKKTDIIITGHISEKDNIGFLLNGTSSATPWNNQLSGVINYQGSIFNSKQTGVYVSAWDYNKALTANIDCYIENAGETATTDLFKSPIVLYAGPASAFDIGNVNINAVVKDTRTTIKHYADVYMYNNVKAIKNININIESDGRHTSLYPIFNYQDGEYTGVLKYKTKPIYNTTAITTAANSGKLLGSKVMINGSATQNLPSSSKYIGNTIEFEQNFANKSSISALSVGDYLILDGAKTSHLVLTELGQKITLKATTAGWEVIEGNLKRGSLFPDRPNISSGYLLWQDLTNNKPILWNGTSWIDVVASNASTTVKGVVNQSAASADTAVAPSATYTQAEVQAILTELRDLKSKLRTAGILAP